MRLWTALQDWDDNELGLMLAVVTKMSRIIAHVGSGDQGSHVLRKLKVLPPLLHNDTTACALGAHPNPIVGLMSGHHEKSYRLRKHKGLCGFDIDTCMHMALLCSGADECSGGRKRRRRPWRTTTRRTGLRT